MKWSFKSKSSNPAAGQAAVPTTGTAAVATNPATTTSSSKQLPPGNTLPGAADDPIVAPTDIADDSADDDVDEEEEEKSASVAKGKEPILDTYHICPAAGPVSARSGMPPLSVMNADKSLQLYYGEVIKVGVFDMVLRRGSGQSGSLAGAFRFHRNAKGQTFMSIHHTDGTKSVFCRTKLAGKGLKYIVELKSAPTSPVTNSQRCIWKVTFAYGVNKLTGASSYKIMDNDEKIVYGAFIKEMGSSKIGRVVILNENVGDRFREQILLCGLALNEFKRRQSKQIKGNKNKTAARVLGGAVGGILGAVISAAV